MHFKLLLLLLLLLLDIVQPLTVLNIKFCCMHMADTLYIL